MQYINYGTTDLVVSRFGLGCMRFPKEQQEAIDMVRYALDHGVNYLDTAYIYNNSEVTLGKALKDGYRNKSVIVAKNPIWDVRKYDDFEKYLDEELKRLEVDYIDIYLLHSLGAENFDKVIQFDGFTFLDKMVEKGKIRHTGFSFHGTNELFKKVVDSYPFEMAQIQLNILDEFQQAGLDGLKYAYQKKMATVIMEPLRGGHIVNNYPEEVDYLIKNYKEKRSLVEWAFRWLYNLKEASVIISGTNNLTQLKENISIFSDAKSDVMSEEDLLLIKAIRTEFEKKNVINCTGCKYCMPCPYGVDIPEIFKLYNSVSVMKSHFIDRLVYRDTILHAGNGADKCVECGICKIHCPQSIDIPEELKKAHQALVKK
ncbi:MAG: aldo/keto reductase [Clostridia bacterium]|nr:aldo/keto reductase [Clostridia bacterium]